MSTARRRSPSRRIGVIDIGTNSTKLTVGEVRDDRVVTHFFARRPSRIGENLTHTGRIGRAPEARTTRDVRALGALARSHGAAAVVAIGTYAFRAASNGEAVAERITRRSGVPVRILEGREEATLAYLSGLTRLRRPKPYTMLIDVGGGSTEFVVAHHGRIVRARSLPLGALRLTERHVVNDPISVRERRAMEREVGVAVARVVAPFRDIAPGDIDFIASGGSATTALAMLPSHRTLSRAGLEALTNACFERTLAQRKRMRGLPADRADILPAGLVIVVAFLRATRKRALAVSDGGVREGVTIAIDAELEAIAHERAHSHGYLK